MDRKFTVCYVLIGLSYVMYNVYVDQTRWIAEIVVKDHYGNIVKNVKPYVVCFSQAQDNYACKVESVR